MRKDYIQTRVIVAWGVGQDSTGLIIGMYERGLRPWKIVFADVGNERAETYIFFAIFCEWLEQVGFPKPEVVRYRAKDFKHWPEYWNLLENCLTNVTLPSLTYGGHSCSKKWKIAAINAYLASLPECQEVWARGEKIDKAIGFDNSPHEQDRATRGCNTFDIRSDEKDKYNLTFPLQAWGWTREDCVAAIERQGLPVPPKSSCFFCPAMKPHEVRTLSERELKICVILEARTVRRHLEKAQDLAYEQGLEAIATQARGEKLLRKDFPVGSTLAPGALGPAPARIDGLWRKPVKGQRGATAKPGSWTEFIRQEGLLPAQEIDRIVAATPTCTFSKGDFERMGFANWTEWLNAILEPSAPELAAEPQLEEAL